MKQMASWLRKVTLGWLAAALLLLPTATCAQAPGAPSKGVPVSKVERKNRAPVSREILRVKLPKPVEAQLENGLTVLILEDSRFPVVTVQFNIGGAGPIYEPADVAGLANITAQMLREGTQTRTSRQIAEEVDQLGATLSASSGFGSAAATVNASGLSDNFDQWFPLALDILLNPSFPADELEKLKQRLQVQLRQQRSAPGFLVTERFNRAVYGTHPAAVVAATPESLGKITSEVLAGWHRERYTPQNALLGIAGDVRANELLPKLQQWLAAWKKTDLKEALPPNPVPAAAKKIYLVDRPNSVQTTVAMGNIALDRRDPDYIPMEVMNQVLGAGPAARLFINLREEKGYTYGAYSSFTALKYPGPWRAGGDVRTEVTEGAMTEFFNELGRIREEKVPEAELEEARRSLVASFALTLEQPTQLLSYAIIRKIYGFAEDYWDTYPAKLMGVTADDVERVARKYINLDTVQVVAVGEASKIKAVLEKYGPVEVYDIEGKPVAAPAAAAEVKSGYFTTSDGVRLHYLEAGRGPAIVFVPGWTMPAWIWEPQIEHFPPRYRVVALDPRSQGESEQVTEGHYPERRAQDVKELIEKLGLAPAVVVGWSMGVPELLAYVEQFGTSTLAGIVLVDGFIGSDPKPEELAQFFGFLKQLTMNRRQALEQFIPQMFKKPQSPEYIKRILESSLKTPTNTAVALIAGLLGRDFRGMLTKLDKPVLYAIQPQFKEHGETLKAKVPSARVEIFEQSGHALFVDEPARFNALVEEVARASFAPR